MKKFSYHLLQLTSGHIMWWQLESIAISVFVVILVEFDKYWDKQACLVTAGGLNCWQIVWWWWPCPCSCYKPRGAGELPSRAHCCRSACNTIHWFIFVFVFISIFVFVFLFVFVFVFCNRGRRELPSRAHCCCATPFSLHCCQPFIWFFTTCNPLLFDIRS